MEFKIYLYAEIVNSHLLFSTHQRLPALLSLLRLNDGIVEESNQRHHSTKRLQDCSVEPVTRGDLGIHPPRRQILPVSQVVRGRVIGRKTARDALELIARQLAEQFAKRSALDDGFEVREAAGNVPANGVQVLRQPDVDAATHEELAGSDVEVETRASMLLKTFSWEHRGNVGLVGRLVFREARVPVLGEAIPLRAQYGSVLDWGTAGRQGGARVGRPRQLRIFRVFSGG